MLLEDALRRMVREEVRSAVEDVIGDKSKPATPLGEDSDLLTISQAVAISGKSESTLRRWAKEGRLQRSGGRVRRSALVAAISAERPADPVESKAEALLKKVR